MRPSLAATPKIVRYTSITSRVLGALEYWTMQMANLNTQEPSHGVRRRDRRGASRTRVEPRSVEDGGI